MDVRKMGIKDLLNYGKVLNAYPLKNPEFAPFRNQDFPLLSDPVIWPKPKPGLVSI